VVSVIVPARNEEGCLGDCLRSLIDQEGIAFEIFVVNDNSTDRTRQLALLHGVKVIDAPPLPVGWTGKSHAAHCGARVACGEWLLFTDADTVHRRHSLSHAVAEAEGNLSDLLSYSPKQVVRGLGERALMPVIFAELRRQYPPREVSDPSSLVAAANGQYLLIRREAYDAIGGHEAVRASLLEDVELARRVKRSGRRIRFRYGRDALKTRMYRTFPQMWEGWTKNLALLFPSPLRLAALRLVEFLASFLGWLAVLVGITAPHYWLAFAGAFLALPVSFKFFRRVRTAHFGWFNTIVSPIGLPIFVLLLVNSRLHYKRNKVVWKGREYAPASKGENGDARKPEESLSIG
jgi:glycosyltransferase involved in cell wall biosynthesis